MGFSRVIILCYLLSLALGQAGIDRPGGDLAGMPVMVTSADACRGLCESRASCHSWVFDSCLDSHYADKIENGIDHPQNDYPGSPFTLSQGGSTDECQAKCTASPGCNGWVVNSCGNECWLKSSYPTNSNPNSCRRSSPNLGNRCWLKSSIPNTMNNRCRTSGVVKINNATSFRNPITNAKVADPWMIKVGDWYYLTATTGGDVTIWRSRDLYNFHDAESKRIWWPTGDYSNLGGIWAPEIHQVNGLFYAYFAAETVAGKNDHHIFVSQSRSSDPFGDWDFKGKLNTPDDNWAIDATLLNRNGQLYLIWSGWDNWNAPRTQNLYIARMSSPTKMSGDRLLLHSPQYDWSRDGDFGIMEGPEILVHNGRTFLVFSASSSWTDRYCLGFMGIEIDADPMNHDAWWRHDQPIMKTGNGVYGPGHCSFTVDRRNNPWIIYHADDVSGAGWGGRTIRAEPFGWNPDGSLALPTPPRNTNQDVPLPA